jgi:hypothetical protein
VTGKNQSAWEKLDDKYGIAQVIESDKVFNLDVEQIREFREPRLLTKVDSRETQPEFLTKNDLGILPLSRSQFLVAKIDTFATVPRSSQDDLKPVTVPDLVGLTAGPKSETTSVLRALHSGALSDFLGEELDITTFGRMGTGSFQFEIAGVPYPVQVNGAQIEVDAGLESGSSLCLVEAKNRIPNTFNLRQLYYPYRTWDNLSAPSHSIRNVFMGVEGDELLILEYAFEDPRVLTSSRVVKSQRYQLVNDLSRSFNVRDALTRPTTPPASTLVPLPQANTVSRIVTIVNLANELGGTVSKDEIVDSELFDIRQAGYYPNAAIYLGYLESIGNGSFRLSPTGQKLALRTTAQQLVDLKLRLTGDEFVRGAITSLLNNRDAQRHLEDLIQTSARWGDLESSTIHRREQTFVAWAKWVLRGADF